MGEAPKPRPWRGRFCKQGRNQSAWYGIWKHEGGAEDLLNEHLCGFSDMLLEGVMSSTLRRVTLRLKRIGVRSPNIQMCPPSLASSLFAQIKSKSKMIWYFIALSQSCLELGW